MRLFLIIPATNKDPICLDCISHLKEKELVRIDGANNRGGIVTLVITSFWKLFMRRIVCDLSKHIEIASDFSLNIFFRSELEIGKEKEKFFFFMIS